ncbi:MAG: hypothetical protein A2252_09710 [Elusimicrobia bacterium RIFOXYA2_FULL_39_19]|nr:MAG: hypothetical protein A2252_09710 [Elusimicrobia bacterium RIFOXYA2_FULL_39_19]
MLIDFHTHFFPHNISKETVDKISLAAGVPHHGNGNLDNLLRFMKKDGVSLSVNLPAATSPAQVKSINRKMVETNAQRFPVICFGALHPLMPHPEHEIRFLHENGIKGVKLHPEYQNFYPDDESLEPIYKTCNKYSMIVVFHAGVDLGFKDVHGTPKRFCKLTRYKNIKFVLAHLGAYRMWDKVEKNLVGKNFYFDISYCNEMDNDQLKRIIFSHGAEKILFATDFPWERAEVMVKKVEQLGLDKENKEKIYYKNAQKLLGL